jgi:hypothetical protein
MPAPKPHPPPPPAFPHPLPLVAERTAGGAMLLVEKGARPTVPAGWERGDLDCGGAGQEGGENRPDAVAQVLATGPTCKRRPPSHPTQPDYPREITVK